MSPRIYFGIVVAVVLAGFSSLGLQAQEPGTASSPWAGPECPRCPPKKAAKATTATSAPGLPGSPTPAPQPTPGRGGPVPTGGQRPASTGCGETMREGKDAYSVYKFAGEFHYSVVDLRIPGRGFDFIWARKYRSQIGPDTAMGNGWDFSYNVYLEPAGPSLILHDGNTRTDLYTFDAARNSWWAPEFFREIIPNPLEGTFTLIFANRGTWNFYGFDGSPVAGKLYSIADRNGNELSLFYDGLGHLIGVLDTLDRWISVGCNADGFIESVTDFSGREVTYQHYGWGEPDGNFGDLKSATSPAVVGTPNGNDFPYGKTTTYTYSTGFPDEALNDNLLTITDPSEQLYLTNVYSGALLPSEPDFDHVIRQYWGDQNPTTGDIIDLAYVPLVPSPDNNFSVIKAIVNDRAGNVSEFFFDAQNRWSMSREYTGRADPDQPTTDSSNRPTGKLRPGDPDFFETRLFYNSDALLTNLIYPNGNEEFFVYDSANDDPRLRGNLLEHCTLPGPLGGDQPQICQYYEYDDGFGGGGGCCGGNFVSRHVDGNGHETLNTLDSNGNRIHTEHRIPSIVEDWEYNSYGQVTAHVLPDNGSGHRRRDEFTYYATGPQTGYRHQSIVDAGGLNLTTADEYDAVGNVIRAIDARGNDTLYDFNQLNQVVRERSREVSLRGGLRYEKLYYYDANDNLVRIDVQNVDENGVVQLNSHFTTLYEYDLLNYLVRTTQEVDETHNLITEYGYDANRNFSVIRYGEATNGHDPYNTVLNLYDERDLLYRTIRAPGSSSQSSDQHDYDGNGNLTLISKGLEESPQLTATVFDGYNRAVSTTDAMGNVTTRHFDANHNQTNSRTDGELVDVPGSAGNVRLYEASYTYDAMDRRTIAEIAFFDPATQLPILDGLATTVTSWSPNSQIVSVTDDNGLGSVTTYDTANRRYEVTDAKGNKVTYAYDENSNQTIVTETEKSDLGEPDAIYSSRYTYDGLDRWIRKENNIGTVEESGYDSRGNLTLATDGEGSKSRYTYDGCERRYNSTYDMDGDGPDGDGPDIVLLQTWDDSWRVIEESDDHGNVTSYSYDPLNRLIRKEYAEGSAETTDYDVHNNAKDKWDTNGTRIQSFFDILNRPTSRDVTPAPGVSDDTTFEVYQYDGMSRMVSTADDDSLVTRGYDSLSHVTAEIINGTMTTAAYDGVGNLLECTYPGGRWVTRTYDSLERVSTIADAAGPLAAYAYVGPDRVERVDFGNGTRTDYAYDGILPNPPGDFGVKQIVGKRHTRIADGSVIDDRTFAWSPAFSKTKRQDVRAGGPGLTHAYGYDPGYRLRQTVVTSPGGDVVRQTEYQLDGVGNRTSVSGPPQPGDYVMDATLPEPADGQMNQYTGTPFDYRQYDHNGNLIALSDCLQGDGNGDFRLDIADIAPFVGALLSGGPASCVVDLDENGDADGLDIQLFVDRLLGATVQTPAILITYDYRNQMVEYYSTQKGMRHLCSYDSLGRRIGKVVDADGSPVETRYYYHGDEAIEEQEQDALGTTQATYVFGPRIDEVLTMNRGGVDYYYHGDGLNSVMALTDTVGTVLERYEYGDYGEPAIRVAVREPDRDEVFDSDADPNPSAIVELIADSFQLTRATTITGLTWWGGYSYGEGAPAADNFTVRIHADSGGLPGTLLHAEALGQVERRATGEVISSVEGDLEEYVYSAVLSEPFAAVAGTTYWLCIADDTTGHPTTWGWESSATGDGDVAWNHNGGPWGHYPANAAFELIAEASAVGNPYLFTGREYDGETGLYYYRARYLEPRSGRFTTRDPAGIWSDPKNLGAGTTYVGNNPWTNTDPYGEITIQPAGALEEYTCGGYRKRWTFTLDKPAPCNGFIVQKIDRYLAYDPCTGEVKREEEHFWESWKVLVGFTQSMETIRTKYTDESSRLPDPHKCGAYMAIGTVKFFCVKKTGDLGDLGQNPRRPNDKWGVGNVPTSGDLPSTDTKPPWWDSMSDGGEMTAWRSAGSVWDCCHTPEWSKAFAVP